MYADMAEKHSKYHRVKGPFSNAGNLLESVRIAAVRWRFLTLRRAPEAPPQEQDDDGADGRGDQRAEKAIDRDLQNLG